LEKGRKCNGSVPRIIIPDSFDVASLEVPGMMKVNLLQERLQKKVMLQRAIIISITLLLFSTPGFSQEPGDIIWQQLYGGVYSDSFSDVKQTSDGGYIAVGSTHSYEPDPGEEYFWVIKTDALGETEWSKVFGTGSGDEAESVAITADDNYIVVGDTYSFAQNGKDAWILKLDGEGDTIWTRTFSGPGSDAAESVIVDNNGDYLVTGYSYNAAGDKDALLLKYDPDGNLLWQQTYGGLDEDWISGLCQTEDGNYVLTGFTRSFGANARDSYLIKTDVNGDTLWTRTYGGPDDQWGRSISNLPDGGVVIAGWTGTFFSASDIWLLRMDSDGDTLWTKTYDYGGNDIANEVIPTYNGGFVICGIANWNFMAMKTSGDGEVQWIQNSLSGVGVGIIQNAEGNYVISGQSSNDALLLNLKGETINQPPAAFSLLEPQDGDTLASLTDPVGFVWESSIDPDNDTIYYTLNIFNDDINLEFPLIEDTTYLFDGSVIFEELTEYQWTVSASDGEFIVVADTFSFITPLAVGIDDFIDKKQRGVTLNQNYPNPFNQETIIAFILDEPMQVTLEIFNMHGKKVRTLVAEYLSVGNFQVRWDGTDASGHKAPKGIYMYRFNGDGFIKSYKMFLTR